jgi:AAA domain-containing protein
VNEYLRQGDLLYRQFAITEQVTLTLRAGDVHQERTGVHARLEIIANKVALAWGVINADKDEDRVRLANSAGKQLNNGHGEIYPNAFLKKDLDDFCRGLYDAEIAQFEPIYDAGLEPAPPDFVLEPFIIRGGGTICFAPPGRGKSWTTMLMAVSIDAGISNIWPVTRSRVLILNLERSATQYMRRIGAINRALALPLDRPIAVLHARGRSLRDVLEGARRFIRREHIEVVILDSISRAGMGELNEGGVGTKIMDAMNGLAESWLAIGHTPRASGEHVTGTMQFDAAADLMVKLSSEQEADGPLGVGLDLTKRNDIPYYKPRILALEFDRALGFIGYREARRGEFPTLEAGRTVSALQQLKDWTLDQVNGLGDATTAARETGLNRATVAVLYGNRDHFVSLGKDGKRALYGVKA